MFPGAGSGIHEEAPFATKGEVMRHPFVVSLVAVALLAVAFAGLPSSDTPSGIDGKSNGIVDDATHQADQAKFEEVESISDGLGPLYNAQSCRECHQSPVSGGGSQVTELRVGHEGAHHRFENAEIPIARGTEIDSARRGHAPPRRSFRGDAPLRKTIAGRSGSHPRIPPISIGRGGHPPTRIGF